MSDEITTLREQLQDYEASWELRQKADERARERWNRAHPDRHLAWPDHADMVVWLIDELDSLLQENHRLRERINVLETL
jgi:hypothetical protein